jgi:2-polyprenyl-3-methyl-5-hydroxy-6-metoxy-1,4-benzoquinol methylase
LAASPLGNALNRHHYPQWLARPWVLRAWHGATLLLTLRNWHIWRGVREHGRAAGTLLDAGCAAGDFLLPLARRHAQLQCTGLDPVPQAVQLCKHYIEAVGLHNACVEQSTIEGFTTPLQYDAVLCLSVLQYTPNDDIALRRLFALTRPGGSLLLYAPVHERRLLPFYARAMHALRHAGYDEAQGRQHSYTTQAILQKLTTAGFALKQMRGAYGLWGKLYYEPYSLLLQCAKALPAWLAWLPLGIVLLLLPLWWVFMLLDYLLPPAPARGNGLLVVAVRP